MNGFVICRDCSNWRPRETDKGLAALGMAVCVVFSRSPGNTFSGTYKRECERFAQAGQSVIDGRVKFEEKKN